jgi:hypothetical protein
MARKCKDYDRIKAERDHFQREANRYHAALQRMIAERNKWRDKANCQDNHFWKNVKELADMRKDIPEERRVLGGVYNFPRPKIKK